jgi:hypothetical protein
MICAEDCAGERMLVFLIGEWYDGKYTDFTEKVLVPILCMRLVSMVIFQFLWQFQQAL